MSLSKTLADLRSPNYHFNPSGQNNGGRGRGGRGGWRGRGGRGRGNGHGNGSGTGQGLAHSQQPAAAGGGGQNDQSQGATGGNNGQQTRTPRQPFCFYCKNQGLDQYNHWPNRCELLGSVISGYHQDQAKSGHSDNMGNSSEHS